MSIKLIYFQNEPGKPKVAVAEVLEGIESGNALLSPELIEESLQIKSLNYRRQWLGTRLLLQTIEPYAGTISYTENGKPFLINFNKELSISHTAQYCAIAISDSPAGLDLEVLGEKVSRISERFLSPSEKEFATTTLQQHIIWGAKEAIFKAWSKGNVQFNCDIVVSPFDAQEEGIITARFRDRDHTLEFKKLGHLMLVYLRD